MQFPGNMKAGLGTHRNLTRTEDLGHSEDDISGFRRKRTAENTEFGPEKRRKREEQVPRISGFLAEILHSLPAESTAELEVHLLSLRACLEQGY